MKCLEEAGVMRLVQRDISLRAESIENPSTLSIYNYNGRFSRVPENFSFPNEFSPANTFKICSFRNFIQPPINLKLYQCSLHHMG